MAAKGRKEHKGRHRSSRTIVARQRARETRKPILYSCTIPPVRRSRKDEVFFLQIEARPTTDSADFGKAGGAFVNCYVYAATLRAAERRSITLIRSHGWLPKRFVEWQLTCPVCAKDERGDDDASTARELVEQAMIDGEVCVFHQWPIDAPDADDADV